MRAVNKGSVPVNEGGVPKTVADYKDWRWDLLERIGPYCCYCNMSLNDSPQVEHVIPKNPRPGHAPGDLLDWNNMLLGCGPCNRKKGNNPVSSATHYLPDFHNTHLIFDYVIISHPKRKDQVACIPRVKAASYVDAAKAQATIDLCGLDQILVNPRATDLRWKRRHEAFLNAIIWKSKWETWPKSKAADFKELLLTTIKHSGFFSIWMNVFSDSLDVVKAIVDGTPGNNLACYDAMDFHFVPHNLP